MPKSPEKYNSLGYFNLARGLGMILILAGHSFVPFTGGNHVTGTPYLFSGLGSVLGGGIMAMFFMISGFGFYTRSPKKCYAIQSKLLLKPYCLVAGALIVARPLLAIVKGRSLPAPLKELLLTYPLALNAENSSALMGEPIRSISILWFIVALFGGWLLYNRIRRIKSDVVRRRVVIGCVILSWLLTLVNRAWPFCLPMALLAVGYLAAGYNMKQKDLLFRKLSRGRWATMILITGISCAFGVVDIGAGIWRLGLIDVAATFCVGYMLMWFYSRFMELNIQNALIQRLERIGNRSIFIVFLHAFEKTLFPWYRLNQILPNQPLLASIVCFVGRSLMIWAIYRAYTICNRHMRKKKKKKIIIEK